MNKVKVEKKRTNNFLPDEKRILSELVLKYQKIVENKKTDSTTNADKLKGWVRLAEEFNNISTFCHRSHMMLKCCWENIKRQTKKDHADRKKEIFKTGGGNPPPPYQGSVVDTILGPALEGVSNIYDSDAMVNETIEVASTSLENVYEAYYIVDENETAAAINHAHENTPTENKENIKKCQNKMEVNARAESASTADDIIIQDNNVTDKWSSWTPNSLRTPVSEPLKVVAEGDNCLKRRRPKNDCSGDTLTKEKIQLVKILQENALKEGAIRIAILEEQLKQEKIKTQKLVN